MTPPAPIDLAAVLLTGLLNPAAIWVAFWMGRYADQRHKIVVAAFAAALAGSVVIYIAVRLGMTGLKHIGRAAAGVFIVQFVSGLAWAYLGYRLFPK